MGMEAMGELFGCEIFLLVFDFSRQLQLMLHLPMEYVMESIVSRGLNTRRGTAQYKEMLARDSCGGNARHEWLDELLKEMANIINQLKDAPHMCSFVIIQICILTRVVRMYMKKLIL